ncbi:MULTISPECIES: hypothetical protein [unclassified Bradyrhizobium]|jgi:hypothetical protein|uniref:hypothetical protein n=1 Tax=unclassified Bradyrhizobium TaxID=2631580 RepID=UPI00350F2C59
MVRIAGSVAILFAALALLNIVYQMIRKPTELFVLVGNALDKDPSENWRQYGPLFRKREAGSGRLHPSVRRRSRHSLRAPPLSHDAR